MASSGVQHEGIGTETSEDFMVGSLVELGGLVAEGAASSSERCADDAAPAMVGGRHRAQCLRKNGQAVESGLWLLAAA